MKTCCRTNGLRDIASTTVQITDGHDLTVGLGTPLLDGSPVRHTIDLVLCRPDPQQEDRSLHYLGEMDDVSCLALIEALVTALRGLRALEETEDVSCPHKTQSQRSRSRWFGPGARVGSPGAPRRGRSAPLPARRARSSGAT